MKKCSKISFVEWTLILGAINLLPLHFMVLKTIRNEALLPFRSYLFYSNLALVIIMGVSLLASYAFKRPYLSILFGCHQKHERSLFIMGHPFIICARCSGILIGIFMALLIPYNDFHPSYLLIGIIPITVDGLLQYKQVIQSTNTRRMITGTFFSPAFVVIFSVYHYLILRFMDFINIIN